MTAAIEDVPRNVYTEGKVFSYPVKAATEIFLRTAVGLDETTGYVEPFAIGSGLKFVGMSDQSVDNSDGSDGDLDVKVRRKGVFEVISSGLAITDGQIDLWWTDDQTVTKVPGAAADYAGKLVVYTSASLALLDIEPALKNFEGDDAEEYLAVPLEANAVVAVGDGVALNVSGYGVDMGQATAQYFRGKAVSAGDNTGGAQGAISVYVRSSGVAQFVAAGLTAADVGLPVYESNKTTITTTPGSLFVGVLKKFNTALIAEVDIDPGVQCPLPSCAYKEIALVGVAANVAITVGQVFLDATGGLVDSDAAGALHMWGWALVAIDNTGGALGDVSALVVRDGVIPMTGAGLAATDIGSEVWQNTDNVTVTTTPGTKLVGVIEAVPTATTPRVRIKPLAKVGGRLDRRFPIPFSHSGATLNGKNARTDMQFDRRYIIISSQFDVEVSPGGTDALTVTINDGTTTFAAVCTEPAVMGENLTPQTLAQAMEANTDTDVTLTDTGTTTADMKGGAIAEYL